MKRPLKIYVDTSVIGGCFDSEFEMASRALFDLARTGEVIFVVSDAVMLELEPAKEEVWNQIHHFPVACKRMVETTEDAVRLQEAYLAARFVRSNAIVDALHIALATVHGCDIVASWNFRDIVNLTKIRSFNAVNLLNGYKEIEIRTPLELLP